MLWANVPGQGISRDPQDRQQSFEALIDFVQGQAFVVRISAPEPLSGFQFPTSAAAGPPAASFLVLFPAD